MKKNGAGDGNRTRDVQLGKLAFYRWITPALLILLKLISQLKSTEKTQQRIVANRAISGILRTISFPVIV